MLIGANFQILTKMVEEEHMLRFIHEEKNFYKDYLSRFYITLDPSGKYLYRQNLLRM